MIKLIYQIYADQYRLHEADIKKGFEIVKFKVNGGFKCTKCNSKHFYDSIEFEHKHLPKEKHTTIRHQERFMASIHSFEAGFICLDCCTEIVKEHIDEVFSTETFHYDPNGKCDWCDTKTETVQGVLSPGELSMTFGQQWWNGFQICRGCLIHGLQQGNNYLKSSIQHIDKDTQKWHSMNRLGMIDRSKE